VINSLDRLERRILRLLQENGRLSNRELAEQIGLSPSPCWRRLKGLEEEGYIQQYTALLDREKLGFSATGFAHVSLENHHQATVAAFDEAIEQWPEVMECYMTSGNYDYMLKIVAVDMTAFERFLSTRLLLLPAIRTVNTSLKANSYPSLCQFACPNKAIYKEENYGARCW